MIKKGKNPLFLFNGEALPSNPQVGYLEENEQLVKVLVILEDKQ